MSGCCNCFCEKRVEDTDCVLDKENNTIEVAMLQAPQSQQQAVPSETGRGRVVLPRGKSLMDWIRLTSAKKNQGFLRKIDAEELRKHADKSDCWILINDKVYNVSEYLSFHPGGVDELMRAAGTDATDLFNEYHSWVNYDTMLKTCLIGHFVDERTKLFKPKESSGTTSSLCEEGFDSADIRTGGTLQGELRVGCSKWVDLTDDNVSVDFYDDQLRIFLHSNNTSPMCLLWSGADAWKFNESFSSCVVNGTICLSFNQEFDFDVILWWKSGKVISNLDPFYRDCQVRDVLKITHNTLQIELQTPALCHLAVPIGHHVLLRINAQDSFIERPYTPISISNNGKTLLFFVKVYNDGLFTSKLKNIQKGDKISVSDPLGTFAVNGEHSKKGVMLAAGTGVTPMIRIIGFRERNKLMTTLLMFNKATGDIPPESTFQQWGIPLNSPLLRIIHCLSEAEQHWTGHKGIMSKELLLEQIGDEQSLAEEIFYICGPDGFVELSLQILVDIGLPCSSVHVFQC